MVNTLRVEKDETTGNFVYRGCITPNELYICKSATECDISSCHHIKPHLKCNACNGSCDEDEPDQLGCMVYHK